MTEGERIIWTVAFTNHLDGYKGSFKVPRLDRAAIHAAEVVTTLREHREAVVDCLRKHTVAKCMYMEMVGKPEG